MKRTMTAILIAGAATIATSLGTFSGVFNKTYSIDKGSKLGKAACMVCHEKAIGGKLNAYGKAVQAEMKEEKTKVLKAEVLKAIEKEDANKNGKSNLEDIKADVNPGL